MKTTILALGFAVMAAVAGSTGAGAFSSPAVAHDSMGGALTPVTYYGGSRYYGYGHGGGGYRWHKGYYGHKRHWGGYRSYNHYRPYGWRHHYRGW